LKQKPEQISFCGLFNCTFQFWCGAGGSSGGLGFLIFKKMIIEKTNKQK